MGGWRVATNLIVIWPAPSVQLPRYIWAKFLYLKSATRHSLKSFGIRLRKFGRGAFDQAVRAAVAVDAVSSETMDAVLPARADLWRQHGRLHDLVVRIVVRNETCRRFIAIPGVGP